MSKSYFYRFVFEIRDPATHDSETPLILEVERTAPIDSRLYRKIRHLAFSFMNEKYWTTRVEIYRFSDVEASTTIFYSKSRPKFIGSIDCTIYTLSTAVGVILPSESGARSCWTWPQRSTRYDWANHTAHHPQSITKEV